MVQSSADSLEMTDDVKSTADIQSLDETNIFASITIGALVLIIPYMLVVEASTLTPLAQGTAIMTQETLVKTVMAGIARFIDVLTSFAILQRVAPVTHSVGNCVKRVVIIAASVIFFGTQPSNLNVIGTVLALGGVFAYSMAKRVQQDKKDMRAAYFAIPPYDRLVTRLKQMVMMRPRDPSRAVISGERYKVGAQEKGGDTEDLQSGGGI